MSGATLGSVLSCCARDSLRSESQDKGVLRCLSARVKWGLLNILSPQSSRENFVENMLLLRHRGQWSGGSHLFGFEAQLVTSCLF